MEKGGRGTLTYCLFISKDVKLITLLRYVITKFFYREESSLEEKLAVFEALLRLEKIGNQPDFKKKFGRTLEVISSELQKSNQANSIQALNSRFRKLSQLPTLKGFLLPRGNLVTLQNLFKGKIQIREQEQQGIPTSQLPPRKVIGKGYTDKGALKNEALHGEQHWTELSSDLLLQINELEKEIQSEKRGLDDSRKIWAYREQLYILYGKCFEIEDYRKGVYESSSSKVPKVESKILDPLRWIDEKYPPHTNKNYSSDVSWKIF